MSHPARLTPPIWLPFAILFAAGAYLVTQWSKAPISGGQVLGPATLIAAGFAVCGLLEAVTYLSQVQLVGQRESALVPEARKELWQVTKELIRIVETGLALAFSAGPILGLSSKGGIHPSFPYLAIGLIALCIWIGCLRLMSCTRELKARGLGQGLEGWNGVTYSNPSDSRIWVPKLGSIGYTLNFAHKKSWLVLALLISPPILTILFVMMVTRP